MSTEHIVGLLIGERDRLEAAISALQGKTTAPAGVYEDPTMPDWVKPKAMLAPAPKKKRKLSAAGRRRIVEAIKARWAKVNAAKAAAVAPVPATPKAAPTKAAVAAKTAAPPKAPVKKGGLTAAGRRALSIAMKKRWAKKKAIAKGKAA